MGELAVRPPARGMEVWREQPRRNPLDGNIVPALWSQDASIVLGRWHGRCLLMLWLSVGSTITVNLPPSIGNSHPLQTADNQVWCYQRERPHRAPFSRAGTA